MPITPRQCPAIPSTLTGSMRLLMLCSICLIMLGGCAYYNTLFNAKKNFNEGVETIQLNPDADRLPNSAKKNFEATIEKCWKLIEIYTDQNKYADDALLYIAKSKFYLSKMAEAKLHLEQFFGKYGDSDLLTEAQLWYAKILLADENVDEARRYLVLVDNNADDPKLRSQANFELGLYSFNRENYDQAIENFNTALKEKIDNEHKALLLFYLGEAYFIQREYKEAIDRFKKVEKHKPTIDVDYRSHLHLGHSYRSLKEFDKAYTIYRKMLNAPRFKDFIAVIKTAIGENYEQQELYEDALDIYKEVVVENRRNSGTAQAAFNLGLMYENLYNDIDSAVTYFGKVEKIDRNFDSLVVAQNKTLFLSEFKTIRDGIRKDERLVYRLKNDNSFRDSLYTAQAEDSLNKILGIVDEDSLRRAEQFLADSLRYIARRDSLRRVVDQFASPTDSVMNARLDSMLAVQDGIIVDTPGNTNGDSDDDDEGGTEDLFAARGEDEAGDAVQNERPLSANQLRNKKDSKEEKTKQVEKRKLPEIEFDLMNNWYHLAEFYLLKVENYDSAEVYYNRFLHTYEDSILTPKALYSMSYIHKASGRPDSKSDSLDNLIVQKFSNSPFANEIKGDRGINIQTESVMTAEEKAENMFVAAESLYYAGQAEQAVVAYKLISTLDSTWEITAKAQYAAGYVYEFDLGMVDSAKAAYQRVVDRTGVNKYANAARRKLTPLPEREEVSIDSSTIAVNDDNTDQNSAQALLGLEPEDILTEKIAWRRKRDYNE